MSQKVEYKKDFVVGVVYSVVQVCFFLFFFLMQKAN